MIGHLSGTVADRDLQTLTLDCHGVGYEVDVPISVLTQAPERGQPFHLFTHLVVREDAQQLFGFATRADRGLFRRLIRVNGIGARLALAMLSTFSSAELTGAIERGDVAALTRIPGIGKKTAERVVLELAGKLEPVSGPSTAAGAPGPADPQSRCEADVLAALQALGYKPADAERMLAAVKGDAALTDRPAEEWVRAALRSTLPATPRGER